MTDRTEHLSQPVMSVARGDFKTLRDNLTVGQAMEDIRSHELGDRIVYFYVVDADDSLVGVLPTRALLTAPTQQGVSDLMIGRVLAIPREATILDACEMFAARRLLALPVVDDRRRILGVVDIGALTEDVLDVADRERMDEVFEAIGFRVSQVREASPFRAFRFRFPWLLATIASGVICAFLSSVYEVTLAESLVLAFFLTLVLGLGESVSIQSMTVTIQTLRSGPPTLSWYARAFRREAGTALLLGISCGVLVALVAWLWRGTALAAVAIGSGIALTICAGCLIGLSIPSLLHALRIDLRIAAGPLTLGLADVATVLIYFGLATLLLM